MDTEKILYLACSANQSSDSNWKSPPPLLLKAYTKLRGGGGQGPPCVRTPCDAVVSRLRIAGLGIGRVDSATGLWYRAVCSAQLARERTERERWKGGGRGGGGGGSCIPDEAGRCHAVLLINDTQFLYHLRVTIMFGSVGLATAVICPQSPPSLSPLSPTHLLLPLVCSNFRGVAQKLHS